jgi:Zn-dependent M28 family amino/carboxypeptidase
LAIARALVRSKPARSVLICAFSGEEAGLLGSKALCASPPIEVEQMVAMLNMDMIGRGEAAEVAVLGTKQNPSLEALLRDANKLGKTGVKKLVTGKGDELWRRSDHYSFHAVGVPTLFFFEGLPISRNADYHTWRDVVGEVDVKKIRNTCRLVHQTLCLIANDESRPPAPRSAR